jgi:hypothetical protein
MFSVESSSKHIGAWIVAVVAGTFTLFGGLLGLGFVFLSPLAGVALWVASGLMLLAGLLAIPRVRAGIGTRFGRTLSSGVSVAVVGGVLFVSVLIFVAGVTGGLMAVPADTTGSSSSFGGSDADTDSVSTPEPDVPKLAVRVQYTGDWQGAVSITGAGSSQTESVSGTGTEVIEITGGVDIVSANAQKQDGGSQRLTIQILQDGDVIAEADTTSEYGVAQVSETV